MTLRPGEPVHACLATGRIGEISRPRRCSTSKAWSISGPRSRLKLPRSYRRHRKCRDDEPIHIRRFCDRLRHRLARGGTGYHGAFADHAQRRSGFCAHPGTGAVDRKDHETDCRPADRAKRSWRQEELADAAKSAGASVRVFCFDAFSLREPVSTPGSSPGRLSLENALMARQCNRGAPELALGPDHHGLPVAARGQGYVGVEPGRARQHLKTAIAAVSREGSVDAAAGFAPGPGKRSALRHHIASEVEFVAVAGAEQVLVEAVSAGAHGIIGATSDPL